MLLCFVIASCAGAVASIRYLLSIESVCDIFKIGIFRSLIKISVGLLTGLSIAFILNSTQHLKSAFLEITIICAGVIFGGFVSLKSYQLMLHRQFGVKKSFKFLFKIGVFEFLFGTIAFAIFSALFMIFI